MHFPLLYVNANSKWVWPVVAQAASVTDGSLTKSAAEGTSAMRASFSIDRSVFRWLPCVRRSCSRRGLRRRSRRCALFSCGRWLEYPDSIVSRYVATMVQISISRIVCDFLVLVFCGELFFLRSSTSQLACQMQ